MNEIFVRLYISKNLYSTKSFSATATLTQRKCDAINETKDIAVRRFRSVIIVTIIIITTTTTAPTEARGLKQKQQQTSPLPPPALYSGPTSDPELPRFNEILAQCNANIVKLNPLGEQSQFQQPNQTDLDEVRQCFMALKQAVTKYCEDFETYDAAKRSYVNTPKIKQWLDAADRIVYFGTGLNILGQ